MIQKRTRVSYGGFQVLIGLSFYNKGQKTGKILDLRINLTITTGNEKKKYAF